MAHEMALAIQSTKLIHDMELVSDMAWKYADAMQAEADKRLKADVGTADSSDWQPDWSQAPDGYNRFVVGSDHGIGFFTDIEPELIDQEYFYVGHNAKVVENHNYQGDWKESLRERP